MARPSRRGLGYFPFDTDFLDDRKIRRLSQKFKNEGVMTYIAALCEIYSTNGYYIPFLPETCFDIGFSIHLEEKEVEEILLYCVEIRLFDRERFEQNGVLTSRGIQARYCEICRICGRKKMPSFTFDLSSTTEEGAEKGMNDLQTSHYSSETDDLCPDKVVSSEQTPLNGAKTPHYSSETDHLCPDRVVYSEETPLNGAKTPHYSPETDGLCTDKVVFSEQTPLNGVKTPLKGNGKGNGNKKQNVSTSNNKTTYDYSSIDTTGEATRRAELLRMAVEATQGR